MGLRGNKQEKLDKDLLNACKKGNLKVVLWLLDHGANINTRDDHGWTPLFTAVFHGKNSDVVENLIYRGADINQPTLSRTSRIRSGYHVTVLPGWTPLHAALRSKNFPVATVLILAGADLEAKEKETGYTALHYAAAYGQFEMVKLLTEKNADLDARDIHGNRPGNLARNNNQEGLSDFFAEVAAVAPPLPPEEKPQAKSGWSRTAQQEVMCVTGLDESSYQLTDIFNFHTRMYTRLAHNSGTGGESQTIRFFDECPDKTVLYDALEQLRALGGDADEAVIEGCVIPKARAARMGQG